MEENPLVANYIRWLETLGKPGVHRVSQFVSRDVRCRNPQYEASGYDGAASLYGRMFEGAASVKTRVLDVAQGASGHNIYLRWDRLTVNEKGGKSTLSGVSELTIGMDGKIAAITDYWDEIPDDNRSFYSKLFNR